MKILVPFASGFEEIEACTIVDVLRRADYEVIVAGIGDKMIEGSHGIKIECDVLFEGVTIEGYDALVLPGGMPGTSNLLESTLLKSLILAANNKGIIIAAICAAPWVLSEAGILDNKKATSYPNFADKLKTAQYSDEKVVVDGNLITSRGVGTALPFSLKIVELLENKEKANKLAEQMLVI
jgi:protein deglycase